MNEHVFALDIGTQSVTGILLHKNDKLFTVDDFYTEQHEERAMLDGQIQDVVQVAEIIQKVKVSLEKNDRKLDRVCVAAAGRALKTIQTTITIPIHERPITSEEQIKHIELSAVQQAQHQLAEEGYSSFNDYHCVGYSVVHYKLDGDKIGSFIDQIGHHVSVEIIATFLPKVVVESLFAALDRANLKMEALTLEPIAAIHVLVPESMRRLNVTLIDIGAGTSDLAIAKDGTIVAYGMVPVAGDEITEQVSDHFLLDFKEAEQLKRKVIEDKSATAEDILGFEVTVTIDELVTIIEDPVDHLAKLLANKILELNNNSPQAIMLIGGGSLTPMIDKKIAHYLNLPPNRVAVRGTEAIHLIDNKDTIPSSPDFVTPIGIAISATENPFQYMNVFVNDKSTFLFTMEKLTIGDCLIQAGIDLNHYYGKIGLAYFVTVNGKQVTIPGSYGKEPTITINGQVATVNHHVYENDFINIIKGADGRSPSVTITDIVGDMEALKIYFNDELKIIKPTYTTNGVEVPANYMIKDNDTIIAKLPETVGDFMDEINIKYEDQVSFKCYVDGVPIQLAQANSKLLLNEHQVTLNTSIRTGMRIEMIAAKQITLEMILNEMNEPFHSQIHISFNDKSISLQQQVIQVKRNGLDLTINDIIKPNDKLEITRLPKKDFIFQDVFRYANIDIPSIGEGYRVLCNGEDVSFHHTIHNGDSLAITFTPQT